MENLMNILSTLPLNTMILMFVFGSLGMSIGFDLFSRGYKMYGFVGLVFSSVTLPPIMFAIGSDLFSICGGLLVAAVVGVLLMKAMQLAMIVSGVIRYEDLYSEDEESKL